MTIYIPDELVTVDGDALTAMNLTVCLGVVALSLVVVVVLPAAAALRIIRLPAGVCCDNACALPAFSLLSMVLIAGLMMGTVRA